ncbi:MAG: hypothetical protein ACRDTT_07780, partial [Pseudonocardiaceae bacterium]
LVLATQAGDASCQDVSRSGYNCHIDTRGLRNENGLVVDVVTNRCDVPPRRQSLTIWIEARPGPGQEWKQVGRSVSDFRTPGPRGLANQVEGGMCQPDVEYSTSWKAEGVAPDGTPFDEEPDGDWFGTGGLC